ncbi:MAG TPA: efflux RND transporter permease subunit [Candidatus Krumholzibacteria bacterium]|nr:efflux RND transporter permease subunit [Candidatus Krumholzibacteria bacterium]HPD71409.1 efflux RND transporter permease subunit [Candidatus Krumholzibacteria bacterium]HRY41658.1 efflux RND transporter permease subunit [Candidatus Krumholzibacteria bacterium]
MNLVRFAVTRPVTVGMIALAAVVFGLVSLGRLDVGLLPEVRYPTLTVQIELPGSAPVDVENLVTRPLEESVGVVPGLRQVHSVSQAGLSQITLEFEWGTAMDYAALDVREKLDLVRLPDDATPPVLLKYDPALDPVLRIGLWGDPGLARVRTVAEDVLKTEIEAIQGVAAARVSGGYEEEIQVLVDEGRLAALGLEIGGVEQALARQDVNASGGRLRDRGAEYIVRTLRRFADLDDLAEVTVGTAGGRPVALGEVAQVVRSHKERTDITHVDGRESVEVAVYKEGDANAVETARRVREALGRIEKRLPAGLQQEILFDQSVYIMQAVDEVRSNAILGGLLAVIVLFVFLRDLRSTLVIAVAIPLSIVATFILMLTRGVSLNVMSLGGLALGVGMLVDNSIVVLEAIQRRRDAAPPGADPRDAAIGGAAEVAGAVTASTLTTIAVFLPIVFVVVGVAGQIFRDQALTVAFSLSVSLLVSLTFTPMAVVLGARRAATGPAGWRARWRPAPRPRPWWRRLLAEAGHALVLGLPLGLVGLLQLGGRGLHRLIVAALAPLTSLHARLWPRVVAGYDRLLVGALRMPGSVLLVVLITAAGAGLLLPRLGTELVPPLAQGSLTLQLELPEGTPLDRTDRTCAALEHALARLPEVRRVAAEVGTSREAGGGVARQKENRAEIHLQLAGSDPQVEAAVLAAARRLAAADRDLRLEVRRPALLNLSAPVEVDVYGQDLAALQRGADAVAAALGDVAGLRDVRQAMVPGSPEIQIALDRDKLGLLGLDQEQVSQTLRSKVGGTVPSRFRDGERHLDIRVQGRADQRSTLAAVRDLVVAERDGITVPLSAVADLAEVRGPAEIHRLGGRRAALVTADLAGRDLGSVSRDIEARLRGVTLPAGVTAALGGQNDEMARSFRSLQLAVWLALFLVYLVMAAQFESIVHPLIIMVTVPLALAGAVYGLALSGRPLSVFAVIGAIMLAGIVVNNGIVLVDRMNQLRRGGLDDARAAARLAGSERLRPIIMTTATTVLGLLPMALGLGEGAELRAPLAITVIAGLTLATGLTLVAVPVLYLLMSGQARAERAERSPASAAGRQVAAALRDPEVAPWD